MDDDVFFFDFEEDFDKFDNVVPRIPPVIAVGSINETGNNDLHNSSVSPNEDSNLDHVMSKTGPENKQQRQVLDDFDESENKLLSQINDDGVLVNTGMLNSRHLPHENTDSAVVQGAAENLNLHIASCSLKHSGKLMGPPTSPLRSLRAITPKSSISLGFKDQKCSKESLASSSKLTVSIANSRNDFFKNWNSNELSNYEKIVNARKRKFPGPAGLLPAIKPQETEQLDKFENPLPQQMTTNIAVDLVPLQKEFKSLPILNPSCETEILHITKIPWRELIKVLNINPNEPNGLLHCMNIRWIRKVISKHPVKTKIPFLALVVQEKPEIKGNKKKLKDCHMNTSIQLMDSSGTIFAAMDAKCFEMYGSELFPGTAIAVKNCGFLRFKHQVILTITRKNLICLVSMKTTVPNKQEKILFASNAHSTDKKNFYETSEGAKIIQFCNFYPSKAMDDYQKIMNTNLEDMTEKSKEPIKVFSGIGKIPKIIGSASSDSICNKQSETFQETSNSGDAVEAMASIPMDWSAFVDDDDDELMRAFDNVDVLMNLNENGSLP